MPETQLIIQVASAVVVASVLILFAYQAIRAQDEARRYELLFRRERSERYRLETDLFVLKSITNGKLENATLHLEAINALIDNEPLTEYDHSLVRLRLREGIEAIGRRS